MAKDNLRLANDAVEQTFHSMKKAEGPVDRYIAKVNEMEDELKEWKKNNPRYLQDEFRILYEDKKQDMKEANERLKDAKS